MTAPTEADFRHQLERTLAEATVAGCDHVDIRSGDLHEQVGGYPRTDHRMPICCAVMRAEMGERDRILRTPRKGNGANLVVRYRLPR